MMWGLDIPYPLASTTKISLSFLNGSRDMIATDTVSRPLVPGIYAPLLTFYLENDEQDLGEFLVPSVWHEGGKS